MKQTTINEVSAPRFSVIVPTYQRRDIVLSSVRALARQEFVGGFEVIVVVDGSNDGSAEALRELVTPFPLTVLEQSNQGAATARNRGADIARGELLLFLDDDMEAHSQLLAEHDRSHRDGADVVLGHIPLHPKSPTSVISDAVKHWAERRAERLSSRGASIPFQDLLTGQISLSRKAFFRVGGFDINFTRDGSFGNEDVDFGYRLLREGYRAVFNPNAISWQYYAVQPRQHLSQWRQAGRADVMLARKHPEQGKAIFFKAQRRTSRYVWRPLFSMPMLAAPVLSMLCWLALSLVERGAKGPMATRLFFEAKAAQYWQGVREAGDIPRDRPMRVLAYHAIADFAGLSVLEPYGVPVDMFRRQLDMLQQAGCRFVGGDEFLRFSGSNGGLPRRALLLTFDDCYEGLVDVVSPILKERGIPAVAFAVSGRLGGTNDWDKPIGGAQLQLLDANGLRKLAESGLEIGAHSRTHRPLTRVSVDELTSEVSGAVTDLEACGIDRPRMFSYPHGESSQIVRTVVEQAGLRAAFSVAPGLMRPGQDPYQVPRIEILRGDVGRRFKKKVILAGRRGFWRETFWFLLRW